MREIKFRIWNDHGQCMHQWPELIEKNKINLLNAKNPTYRVMQFTGLKDLNGVDIYEGDILSIKFIDYFSNDCVTIDDNEDEDHEVVAKVHWCNSGYWLFSETDATWYFPQSLDDCATVKIIGNIHQQASNTSNSVF